MIRYFAAHPTAANLLMIGIIVLGLGATLSVKRETFPDVPPDKIEVRAVYPGAGALDVESAVCRRIEDALEGVSNIEETLCDSREGIATATIKMRDGGNFDRLFDDVKTAVEAVDSFPGIMEMPVIRQLGRTDFVAALAVTGPMSVSSLKAYAEQLKDRMMETGDISEIVIKGFSDHQFLIEIPALTLRQFGLSVSDIADVIARQSIDLPGGGIETGAQDILIRFTDERRTLDELSDLVVVGGGAGGEVRLGDIATLTDRFELAESKIVFNGQRAAVLNIYKTTNEDTLNVIDAVKAFIAEQKQRAPPGVEFVVTQNISSIVRDRLNMILNNGIKGLGLAFLVLWLFFSFRYSFWVAMGLPISFLGTIAVMAVTGYSFDMITMVGLLIAIGLLMDDAIVLAENIEAHLSRGKSPLDAAVDGTREVAPGVISSYLTTVCIFGSLLFLKGDIGHILKVLPVILIATLSVSLVEAFLILPHHLAHSLSKAAKRKPTAFRLGFEVRLEWVRQSLVGRIVDTAVAWRYLTLGLTLGLFLISISMIAGGILKFSAFPDIDGNVIEARLLLPQGTPLQQTERVAGLVTNALERINAAHTPDQPGGRALVENVNIQYGLNKDAFESGPHVVTISVDLLDTELRTLTLNEMLAAWRQESGVLPDVLSAKFVKYAHGPAGRDIKIRLSGADLNILKAASLDMQHGLSGFHGILNLTDDLRPGKPEVRLRLGDGAMSLGLTASMIAEQLRAAFRGKTASEIQVGSESYEIHVRLAQADRNSLADLEYFTVTLPGGKQVPLGAVADLEYGRGFARIAHVNGLRTITILGEVDSRIANISEITNQTRARFLPDFKKRFPTVRVGFEGNVKEGGKTSTSILLGFVLGLIGVYLLLSFQFRSYLEPIVVMTAIPLGLIGVIWGHLIMGLDLSMPSMLGFASLAGVVVNDSILLILFIKIRRGEGLNCRDAAGQASRQRFRAVFLTSMTTIAGVLPLLTETSLQAQILIPLITSLAFGLMASTLLVLFVVPAFYTILDDFGLTKLEQDTDDAVAVAVAESV